MKNIVILISGSGSNMLAIVHAAAQQDWLGKYGATVTCVVSNRADAPGLISAAALGIATHVVDHKLFSSRQAFDTALASQLDAYQPALVVLAGFMRILTDEFVAQFDGRLINIHPSLLPAFTGLNTHQRAIDAGCTVAGATVHLVTGQLDHGQILARAEVPVSKSETAATLAAKVLLQEHVLYPQAIAAWLGKLQQPASS